MSGLPALILGLITPFLPQGFTWNLDQRPLVLSFTGDIMAHEVNFSMGNFDHIYEGVRDILTADDLSFGNLETPVDPAVPYRTYPAFNVHPAYAAAAIRGGFDVFSLANNHTNDQGTGSMQETLKSLGLLDGMKPLYFHGIRKTEGVPQEPVIITLDGMRLGFLSLTTLLNQPRGSGFIEYYPYLDFWSGRVNSQVRQELVKRVREAAGTCDFLVVGIHDGLEYVKEPFQAQKDLYRELIEAGAGVIWAHHPHVLLPYETWKAGPREGIILYSMGNFISGQTWGLGPSQHSSDRARTGDGAIIQILVFRTPTGIYPGISRVHLLNNYRDPVKGMIVVPTQTLAETAPSPVWRSYFKTRLSAQKKLFGLDSPAPASGAAP